jgi:plasmid maintenance system antidote protein VapI
MLPPVASGFDAPDAKSPARSRRAESQRLASADPSDLQDCLSVRYCIEPASRKMVPADLKVGGMSKGQLSAEQNARLRRLVRDELLTRVPKQLHLARLLGMPQGNVSRFLDGQLGATAPIVLRIASLLNRSVEDVLGVPPAPELVDPQEWRYPSRIISAALHTARVFG